jgi:hypothetical protein
MQVGWFSPRHCGPVPRTRGPRETSPNFRSIGLFGSPFQGLVVCVRRVPSALRWADVVCPVGAQYKGRLRLVFSAPLRLCAIPLAFHISLFAQLPRDCGVPARPLRGLEAQSSKTIRKTLLLIGHESGMTTVCPRFSNLVELLRRPP